MSGFSRRNFIKQTSLGLGAGLTGISITSCNTETHSGGSKLPREICVASIDLKGLWPDTTRESRIKNILNRMTEVAVLHPDLICLPELFDTIWVDEQLSINEIAEDENIPGPVTSLIAEFAKKHSCYVVCPVYTTSDGHFYNSSILLDRKGEIAGVYHKIHPTKSEILQSKENNSITITPGAIDQPVIETDFGKIGMQICYDANWSDGWENLKRKGADIILFSSAFPGGRMLNHYALKNSCYIISSTGGDARIVDISGNDLDSSSTFVRYAWANINLEKVCVDTWPANGSLPEMFAKYGKRIEIKVWDKTDIITIESRDPSIKISDVLREFEIPQVDENIRKAEEVQNKYRL